MRSTRSAAKPSTTYGKNHTSSRYVLTQSFAGVLPTRKSPRSWLNAMEDKWEDILGQIELHTRCCNPDSIGLQSTRMLANSLSDAMFASEWATFQDETKCQRSPIFNLSCSMYGELTSWDPSLTHTAIPKSWSLWTMSLSGWKQLLCQTTRLDRSPSSSRKTSSQGLESQGS